MDFDEFWSEVWNVWIPVIPKHTKFCWEKNKSWWLHAAIEAAARIQAGADELEDYDPQAQAKKSSWSTTGLSENVGLIFPMK